MESTLDECLDPILMWHRHLLLQLFMINNILLLQQIEAAKKVYTVKVLPKLRPISSRFASFRRTFASFLRRFAFFSRTTASFSSKVTGFWSDCTSSVLMTGFCNILTTSELCFISFSAKSFFCTLAFFRFTYVIGVVLRFVFGVRILNLSLISCRLKIKELFGRLCRLDLRTFGVDSESAEKNGGNNIDNNYYRICKQFIAKSITYVVTNSLPSHSPF